MQESIDSWLSKNPGHGAVASETIHRALSGSRECQLDMLANPWLAKRWLGEAVPGSTVEFAPRKMFLSLPQSEQALRDEYAKLSSKSGRVDFKSDVQNIEQAIVSGSAAALASICERSPMALWAMDFSLSEYEAENILAFACKYAPAGFDLDIVDLLVSMGAKLPSAKLCLVVGCGHPGVEGAARKTVEDHARALVRAGYEFGFADGLALLQKGSFERGTSGNLMALSLEKIEWLEEIERRGDQDWSLRHSSEILALELAILGGEFGKAQKESDFLNHAKNEGASGLGAWIALGPSPLRTAQDWAPWGQWLSSKGLASEALRAAMASGQSSAAEALLPWAELEELSSDQNVACGRTAKKWSAL